MAATLFWVNALAQEPNHIIRIARLVIDSALLTQYNAALKEEIETAVRVEPGVLTLYALAEKENRTHVTIFEIYASTDAYRSHIQTAHFRKYKSITKDMVKSLILSEVIAIGLESKLKQ